MGDVIDATEARFGGRVFDGRFSTGRDEAVEGRGGERAGAGGRGRVDGVGERESGEWCGIQFV